MTFLSIVPNALVIIIHHLESEIHDRLELLPVIPFAVISKSIERF